MYEAGNENGCFGLENSPFLALRDILIKMSTAKCHANYAIWLNFVLF